MKPAQTRHDVLDRLATNWSAIHARGVERLGLFGSFARDDAHAHSDVDLLVYFRPDEKTYANLFELSELLKALLGRKVELVTPESVSGELLTRMTREVDYVEGPPALHPPHP
ncbi:nucleotidyltransferase [Lujinxingia sediminis]|uniref:Nucleotidyltransferase n=1 Tax=Lujinxingia sediminis TaxID=2480984 RepID=A0ABY0CMV5_9DELT|nr:nucleotidyltransferase family protein [Lujinxingia sediminis]RVU40410.1 nucleotidyltransferase [Lujinxingia sediminis]